MLQNLLYNMKYVYDGVIDIDWLCNTIIVALRQCSALFYSIKA